MTKSPVAPSPETDQTIATLTVQRAELQNRLDDLSAQLARLNREINEGRKQEVEQDQVIQSLGVRAAGLNKELGRIYASRAWRLLCYYRDQLRRGDKGPAAAASRSKIRSKDLPLQSSASIGTTPQLSPTRKRAGAHAPANPFQACVLWKEQASALAVLAEKLQISLRPTELLAGLKAAMNGVDLQNMLVLLSYIARHWSANPAGTRPGIVLRGEDLAARPDWSADRNNLFFLTGEFLSDKHGGGDKLGDFVTIMSRAHDIYLYSWFDGSEEPEREAYLQQFCRRMQKVLHREFEYNPGRVRDFLAGKPMDFVHYAWPRALSNYDPNWGKYQLFLVIEAVSLSLANDLKKEAAGSNAWYACLVQLINALKIEVADAEPMDAVVVVTQADGEFLAQFTPRQRYIVVNHGINLDRISLPDSPPEIKSLVFVGNYHHYPNEEGICYFIEQILPMIRAAEPDVKLYLVGACPTPRVQSYHDGQKVIVTGEVPDFRPYIQRGAVCLAPLISGAGIRAKVIQYAALRRPCVATSLATADLVFEPGRDIHVADHATEFAGRVIDLLRHPESAQQMAASAYEKVVRHYDARQLAGYLYRIYASLADNPPRSASMSYGKASLIIVSYNSLPLLRECVTSILTRTRYPDYDLIIVDNNSADEVKRYLAALQQQEPRVRVIFNDSNRGFAAANNQGIQLAQASEMLVLLNNDTVVPTGWLARLLRYAARPEVGLVGPVTNWTGNEAKIDVGYTNLEQMDAFAQAYMTAHSGECFDIGTLAMYCVAARRHVVEQIGLLDERYGLGMFEDCDYAHRLRLAGYRVICAEDVFVHHYGMSSFAKLPLAEYRALFERNRELYEQKWGEPWQPYSSRRSPNGRPTPYAVPTAPPVIDRFGPTQIIAGQRFNAQSNGQSAIWLHTRHATPATLVLFDGKPIQPTYASSRLLTFMVPPEANRLPGVHTLCLMEPASQAKSNSVEFVVIG